MQDPSVWRRYLSRGLIGLIVAMEVGSLLWAQLEKQLGLFGSGLSYIIVSHYGWPLLFLDEIETGSFRNASPTIEYQWYAWRLFYNVVICLFLIGSTVACAWYFRRPKWYQLTLRSMFVFTATLGILLTVVLQWPAIWEQLGTWNSSLSHGLSPYGFSVFASDFTHWPILLAMVCLTFALPHVALCCVLRARSLAIRWVKRNEP